jgi:hypothetical protein
MSSPTTAMRVEYERPSSEKAATTNMRTILLGTCSLILALTSACGGDDSTGSTTGSTSGATTSGSTGGGGAGASGGMGGSGGGGAQGGGGMNVAPAAPVNLSLALTTTPYGVDMTWEASPDADVFGYVAVRSVLPFDGSDAPVDGQTYSVGDMLPGGAEVVFVGDTVMGTDPNAPLEATSHYAVFAVDTGTLHSPGTSASIDIGFPVQSGSIEISNVMTTPVVTIPQQPSHVQLSATASYIAPTLTLSLTIANAAHRVLFSPKVAVDTINAGAVTSDGTTVDGRVSAYYGPAGLGVGASQTRDFVITGIGAADPVVLGVEVLNNPMGMANAASNKGQMNFFDLSGARDGGGVAFGGQVAFALGWKSGAMIDGRMSGGALSPDGLFLSTGWKSRPIVAQVDMTTLQAVTSTDLSQGTTNYGFTSDVVMSPDGVSLYTLVTSGAHNYTGGPNYQNSSDIDLVQLDRLTLAEMGRINLVTAAPVQATGRPAKGNDLALSADGSRIVAAVEPGQLWVIDASTFSLIDADPATAGDQPVDVSAVSLAARIVAVNATATTAYVGYHRPNNATTGVDLISVVDLATFAVSTITSTATAGANSLGWSALTFGPDGLLYLARNQSLAGDDVSLSIFDPGTSAHDDRLTAVQVMGLSFDPRGGRYYVLQRNTGAPNNFGEILTFNAADHSLIDIDGNAANGQTNLPAANVSTAAAHAHNITPF